MNAGERERSVTTWEQLLSFTDAFVSGQRSRNIYIPWFGEKTQRSACTKLKFREETLLADTGLENCVIAAAACPWTRSDRSFPLKRTLPRTVGFPRSV